MWLIERFSPWLLIQARYRLRGHVLPFQDPEDLVQDVWVAALPALPELSERGGRHTPTLVRFLSTVLLRRLRRVIERSLHERSLRASGSQSDVGSMPAELRESIQGPLQRLVRDERQRRLEEALARLRPRERDLIVLRGIEQHPYREICVLLRLQPNAAAVAYRRALQRLAGLLGPTTFDDLAGD